MGWGISYVAGMMLLPVVLLFAGECISDYLEGRGKK